MPCIRTRTCTRTHTHTHLHTHCMRYKLQGQPYYSLGASPLKFYAARVYIFIHPTVYEIHGFCTSCFSFEVWLHHSTNVHVLFLQEKQSGASQYKCTRTISIRKAIGDIGLIRSSTSQRVRCYVRDFTVYCVHCTI